jgi:hypothetical protein
MEGGVPMDSIEEIEDQYKMLWILSNDLERMAAELKDELCIGPDDVRMNLLADIQITHSDIVRVNKLLRELEEEANSWTGVNTISKDFWVQLSQGNFADYCEACHKRKYF